MGGLSEVAKADIKGRISSVDCLIAFTGIASTTTSPHDLRVQLPSLLCYLR